MKSNPLYILLGTFFIHLHSWVGCSPSVDTCPPVYVSHCNRGWLLFRQHGNLLDSLTDVSFCFLRGVNVFSSNIFRVHETGCKQHCVFWIINFWLKNSQTVCNKLKPSVWLLNSVLTDQCGDSLGLQWSFSCTLHVDRPWIDTLQWVRELLK